MTTIYLIRHAEAEGNAYRRIHGQYDSRITPNGLRQIAALKRRFEDIPVDACYASDLNRTCVTARAVYLPKGLELHRDARFREVALGRWEGLPFGWLERFEPEKMRQFNDDPLHWSVEGSETFPIYTARYLEALGEAAEANDGKTIAVVAHGCVMRGVQYLLAGNEFPPYCDNTAVSLLRYAGGRYQIEFLNDNSHLSDEISTFSRQKWWRESGEHRDFNMWFEPNGETVRAYLGDEPIGLLRLSHARCAGDALRIEQMELDAPRRGMLLGDQLLGEAITSARAQGCTALTADVPEAAQGFFLRTGFVRGETAGERSTMTLDISVPQ